MSITWRQEKVQNKVNVELFRGNSSYRGKVGVADLNGKKAFGLLDSDDYMTFMCYDLDVLSPEDMLFLSSDNGWWWFHKGAQIKIRDEELRSAFTNLGLIK